MISATIPDSALAEAWQAWLKAQVLQLSVDTLQSNAVTCTACGEVLGTYIVDYQGHQFRLSLEEAYGFLKFIQAG
ncbi:hypothetical protein [Nodosilinea nodulosa]|uniref:hypothetical protein n=1 Tax=Nodosilinea nodulosa TaxID=416001 RepID=UPI0002F3A7A7|nr:hypothetical protein [Nodosilinea nodulosa]